jgi:hypothetical protein
LYDFYKIEWSHQEIVIRTLRSYGNLRQHDWSKDYFYIYALAGKFKFSITNERFQNEVQQEIERHYRLEPHHPEFEKSSGDINIMGVQEMAIDRLSRNVWKNKGSVDEGEMEKYLPTFVGDDPKTKLEHYKLYVSGMADKVKQVYEDVMNETEEVKPLPRRVCLWAKEKL